MENVSFSEGRSSNSLAQDCGCDLRILRGLHGCHAHGLLRGRFAHVLAPLWVGLLTGAPLGIGRGKSNADIA